MPVFSQPTSLADGAAAGSRGSAVASDSHARTMSHIRPRFAVGEVRSAHSS